MPDDLYSSQTPRPRRPWTVTPSHESGPVSARSRHGVGRAEPGDPGGRPRRRSKETDSDGNLDRQTPTPPIRGRLALEKLKESRDIKPFTSDQT